MAEPIFQPEAERDLAEAPHWYEERGPGLGTRFLQSVEACVQLIRRHPEIFPLVHEDIRQGLLRHFPYSLLYVVVENQVFVLSVFHSSRDPQVWKDRFDR